MYCRIPSFELIINDIKECVNIIAFPLSHPLDPNIQLYTVQVFYHHCICSPGAVLNDCEK